MMGNLPLRCCVSAIALAIATGAAAQDGPQSGPTAGGYQVDDIIVTAQRREQNLQKVSASVTAFDSKSLASQAVQDLTNLNAKVPLSLIHI